MHFKLLDDLNKNGRLAAILGRIFVISDIKTCPELFLRDDQADLNQSWYDDHAYWVTGARHFFSRFEQKWSTGGHFVFIMSMPVSLECNDCFRLNLVHI